MRKDRVPSVIEILFKPILIVLAVTGVFLQARDDGGFFSTNTYLYFTILSNSMTAIIFFIFFVLETAERIARKCFIPSWMFTLKYMLTSAMFTTLLVSSIFLAPLKSQAYLFSLKNLSLHIFSPLAAVVDFLVFDRRFRNGVKAFLLSYAFPLVYLTATLLLSIKTINYSNGSNFPYYFLDYKSRGWWSMSINSLGVFWWIAMIAVIICISTLILLGIKSVISRKYSAIR